MKPFVTALICLSILGAGLYIKPSPFSDGRRFEIYDANWQRIGYILKDGLRPEIYQVFDKDWKRKGYIKQNDFGERR